MQKNSFFSAVNKLVTCVPGSSSFVTHPYLDSRIRTTGYGSGSCSFSSVTFKMLPSFFAYYLPKVFVQYCTCSTFKDIKLLGSHKIVEIKVFSNFFACWWKARIHTPQPYTKCGSAWRPKNLWILRIWILIRNTGRHCKKKVENIFREENVLKDTQK